MDSIKNEQELIAEAIKYAKANKKRIAKELTNKSIYLPEEQPVSVFMAGSPGAGKTEASLELTSQFDQAILRIDADEYRSEIPGYKGSNSHLIHGAASILLEKVHDFALEQSQSFIMDGTLSNIEKSRNNIQRSLKKKRFVQILYVYQDPLLAWKFVQAREATEGRRIQKETFIHQYFKARDNANQLKVVFGAQVKVDLLVKNIDNSTREYHSNVQNIDNHIHEKYTAESLNTLILQE